MEHRIQREHSQSTGRREADVSALQSHADLSPQLFQQFQKLIYHETGIWLGRHKAALLVGRLSKRLRSLALNTMSEYFQVVSRPDQQDERTLMIDCITTNETHFFREPRHFDFLVHTVFPRWREEALCGMRARRIRIWSAGCSSGEEPYSLAMLLMDYFGNDSSWTFEVVGTDISTRVLERAQHGIFPVARARDIPAKYLSSYFLKGTGEQSGLIKVGRELQRFVRFSYLNLHTDSYNLTGQFDLIFLRNVMIYFDQKSKTRVLAKIENYLSSEGYLFVGHSEGLQGVNTRLRSISPGVYAGISGDAGKDC